VLPLNQSALSVTWASTSTATLAPPPMYAEPCHAVSLRCDNFDIYADTSPTTASVLSLSRSSTPGSTTAISCLSGFLSTSNDAYRPYSMLQHVWCSDFVATTKSLTPSRYYTAGLRVPERVNFKLALMAYHVLNGMAPSYLNQLVPVSSLTGRRRLRSSFTLQLAARPVIPSDNSRPSLVSGRSLYVLEHSAR